jgi:putative ABC transport system permease protein
MNTKIKQILYDLRHQPVIAWVTILGTALSVFLILIVTMIMNVDLINIAPESHRDRMLYGKYMHTTAIGVDQGDRSSDMSSYVAHKLYGDLDGVEQTSYFCDWMQSYDVKGTTGKSFSANVRLCDNAFWKIYDHTLIAGRFFTKEESDAEAKVAVLSESTARNLFQSTDVVGKNFLCNHKTYKVVGIVKDCSLLARCACGDLFIPFPLSSQDQTMMTSSFGSVTVALLVKEGVDFEYIRAQVKQRYAEYDTELAADNEKTVYHEAPYDQKTMMHLNGSNVTPDHSTSDTLHWLLYALLLIVPAINLSSMLHSRMNRRVSEIGIRRAYGCTRWRIINDIVAENMIVTLAGGVIGLIAAILVAMFYDNLFTTGYGMTTPAIGMILNGYTILTTFVVCLALNLISAAVPAWQASRLNPVDAINSNHN